MLPMAAYSTPSRDQAVRADGWEAGLLTMPQVLVDLAATAEASVMGMSRQQQAQVAAPEPKTLMTAR